MEKEMQQRLSEPISTSSHVRLTEFPIYGEFLNPGIYLWEIFMYDLYCYIKIKFLHFKNNFCKL